MREQGRAACGSPSDDRRDVRPRGGVVGGIRNRAVLRLHAPAARWPPASETARRAWSRPRAASSTWLRASSTSPGSPTTAWVAPAWCVWLRDMETSDPRQRRKHSGRLWNQPIFFHVMDDPVDLAILAEVSRDPRATLAQLSEHVGLGVSAVQARLRRLESTRRDRRLSRPPRPRGGRQVALGIHRDHTARSRPSPTTPPSCSSTSRRSRRATRSPATRATSSSSGSRRRGISRRSSATSVSPRP